MKPTEFPLVISPSLGCPQVISLSKDKKGESISVIIASMDARFGKWSLIPSSSNQYEGLNRIPLVQEEVQEIPQDSDLPSSVNETMEIISRELLMEVLGGKARIFKISLSLSESDPSKLLRKVNGYFRPTLYDLCLEEPVFQKKFHAICLIESKDNGLRFIHLTDLHLARRNDLIEGEISTAIGPIAGFNDFNYRMRIFIKKANELADNGELDIVLIGGDLVDFVNHGISDKVIETDNNWQVFVEIMTGGGNEQEKGNYGIRVPIFTSTGNHDWRLHPYDIANVASNFGIDSAKASHFDFEYYDSPERLEAKINEVYERIVKKGSPISKENLLHTVVKWVLGYSETWQAKALVPIISAVLSSLFPGIQAFSIWPVIVFLIATLLHYIINLYLAKKVGYMVTHAVIPVEASVHALHYYFRHINPHFNYAFSFGSNYFIMMDTGPDCFTGQYLWDEGNKKRVRMSIRDNILGGSPDSMAFYPVNEYYSYGQIIWLERILKAIELESETKNKRIFVCLHAPPINVKNIPDIPDGKDEELLEKGRIDIRYGTINHFLSQFFHLCLGKKENDPGYSGPRVDIVFSGHAHQKIEFRIGPGPLIYCGRYSDTITQINFNDKRPFVVQTAACGPLNKKDYSSPPYFRTVHVDRNGVILKFG